MERAAIVIVEDEGLIASSVAKRLEAEGYAVEVAHDGLAGVELVRRTAPDLVVLDLMLPGLDGIEVCRRIQADRPVPVIMLTARDTETDLLVGLGVGADDYLTKPFSMRELVARVGAVLRRVERGGATGEDVRGLGDVHVDVRRRRVRIAGRYVELTPTEFDLLEHLTRRPGHVADRATLLRELWGVADAGSTRTVDSHVAGLRRKLGGDYIRTVHGVGYAFEADAPNPGAGG